MYNPYENEPEKENNPLADIHPNIERHGCTGREACKTVNGLPHIKDTKPTEVIDYFNMNEWRKVNQEFVLKQKEQAKLISDKTETGD